MARNGLANSKNGKSKSARYYQNNPEAREKKNDYDTKYHSTPLRRKYRNTLNKMNRKMKSKEGDGMDISHTSEGGFIKESMRSNRARNGHGDNKRLK